VKLAFITPRYGAEITSGAEHACRLIAEHAGARHDVEVLTTTARDDSSWRNEYGEGADRVRGVLVRRFAVGHGRDARALAELQARMRTNPRSRAEELEWVRHSGPSSPALIEFLQRQHRSYDALIFCPLVQATTVEGFPIAPERSIVLPYLQLIPQLRFSLWADLLSSAAAVGLFARSEHQLLRNYIGATARIEEMVGIGIDPPPQLTYPRHQQNPADTLVPEDGDAGESLETAPEPWYLAARGVTFRRRHRLYGPFALYGGRVESSNGAEEMLEYFHDYAGTGEPLPLVLMGAKMMRLPEDRGVVLGGVLPDRERMSAYEAADVTIDPSPDDLLAETTLESFAVGTPVLASARNDAAVEHCRRANAGLFYADRREFAEALALLAGRPALREALGENGRKYVRQHFRWEHVVGRFERLVTRARTGKSS
jgi:glycosyltransferase involved in cell wall biosynthesis